MGSVSISDADHFKLSMIRIAPAHREHRSRLDFDRKGVEHELQGLGPWADSLAPEILENYKCPARIQPLVFSETPAVFTDWAQENRAARIGKWPTPDADEIDWYRRRRDKDIHIWEEAKIADAIDLCFALKLGGGNRAPIVAAACFWDTASNTFAFPFGQLGIPLVDIYAITGLPIADTQYRHQDYQGVLVAHPAPKDRPKTSYGAWVKHFAAKDTPESGVAFLELWLMKYVECCKANKPTNHWSRVAELLYKGVRINLLQMATGLLYRGLYHLATSPFKYSTIAGPFWILNLWLQIYFTPFRNPQVVTYPPRKVMGMAFANTSPFPCPSFISCVKHLFNMEDFPLGPSLRILKRRYPAALANGFMWTSAHSVDGNLLFQQSMTITDLILITPQCGVELYAPNHFARQLGARQMIPFPAMDSLNKYTSWRIALNRGNKMTEPSEIQFRGFHSPFLPTVAFVSAAPAVSHEYEAWWAGLCEDNWSKSPEATFWKIFKNGRKWLTHREDVKALGPARVPRALPDPGSHHTNAANAAPEPESPANEASSSAAPASRPKRRRNLNLEPLSEEEEMEKEPVANESSEASEETPLITRSQRRRMNPSDEGSSRTPPGQPNDSDVEILEEDPDVPDVVEMRVIDQFMFEIGINATPLNCLDANPNPVTDDSGEGPEANVNGEEEAPEDHRLHMLANASSCAPSSSPRNTPLFLPWVGSQIAVEVVTQTNAAEVHSPQETLAAGTFGAATEVDATETASHSPPNEQVRSPATELLPKATEEIMPEASDAGSRSEEAPEISAAVAPHSPTLGGVAAPAAIIAPHISEVVMAEASPSPSLLQTLSGNAANATPAAIMIPSPSIASSSSVRAVADRLRALRRNPSRPAEVLKAKAFLAGLDQLDLKAEGTETEIRAQVKILRPYATSEESKNLDILEANLERLYNRFEDLQALEDEPRKRQDILSQLNQSAHIEQKQLEEYFEKTVVSVDHEIEELEKRKAAIEAELERKKKVRDQELAFADQKISELQDRQKEIDQASSAARTSENHYKICLAEIDFLKVELDVSGKLFK